MLVVELLEHVGLELLVLPDRLEDLLALLVRGGLDQVGDLRRVEPDDPPRRQLQPRGRDVADERLEVPPIDELPMVGVVAAEPAREEPPQAGAEARVDPGDAPTAVVVADQLDLSGLDETGGLDIDDAAIEDVRTEQHLARAAFERRHIKLRGRGRHRVRAELLDPVDRYEQVTAAQMRGQADDPSVTVPRVESRHHVVDFSKPLTGGVEQRTPRQ